MNKNKLILETIYLVLGFIGIIGAFGYFNQSFNKNVFVFFTNLSNFVSIGIVSFDFYLTYTERKLKNKNAYNLISYCGLISLLVTFLVYNILLTNDVTFKDYIFSPNNLIMHVILPLLYLVHWILYRNIGDAKWYYPLASTIFPLLYVAVILLRSLIPNINGTIFPYFFLNYENIGILGVFGWISILVIIFILIGYLLNLIDKKMNAHT